MENSQIEALAKTVVLGSKEESVRAAREIVDEAKSSGLYPASIYPLYHARGIGEVNRNFTVPAVNVRGLNYYLVKSIFEAAINKYSPLIIFEIARSELVYTEQEPYQFSALVFAGALTAGYSGPVFLQGDHLQPKGKQGVPEPGEEAALGQLIDRLMRAGFYNLDIDTSTLVDLEAPTVKEQQIPNSTITARLVENIRKHQPAGVEVSIGGEIGHIGGTNSTVEEFEAYISLLKDQLQPGVTGIAKAAVQTGSSHGGEMLPDGTIKEVQLDFEVHRQISAVARDKYDLAGTVQHGASTLPTEMLSKLPEVGATEVHLATGIQNMILGHPAFPAELTGEMDRWLDGNATKEKEPDWNDQQFHYKLRKKVWAPFAKELLALPAEIKAEIFSSVRAYFENIFDLLQVTGSNDWAIHYFKPVEFEFNPESVTTTDEDGLDKLSD